MLVLLIILSVLLFYISIMWLINNRFLFVTIFLFFNYFSQHYVFIFSFVIMLNCITYFMLHSSIVVNHRDPNNRCSQRKLFESPAENKSGNLCSARTETLVVSLCLWQLWGFFKFSFNQLRDWRHRSSRSTRPLWFYLFSLLFFFFCLFSS